MKGEDITLVLVLAFTIIFIFLLGAGAFG